MAKLKRLKYNKDYMSDKMDSYMEQIEDNLSALYANASYEINQKFAEFAKGFEKQDADMQAKVEAGKVTPEEYGQWRSRKMVQNEMYRATVDEMSTMLVNTDVAAMALVNGAMPSVVAQSYNFTQALGFEAAKKAGITQGTFQVYNARSVQKIIKDNPKLLKEVDMDEDKKWNRQKLNREITQGIVQGEPIEKISGRLQRVTDMDNNAATRNARTMMTSAENIGRSEAADELKEQGIPMEEVWSATYDDRTRESHLMLDGTVRDENGYFGADFLLHPLRYPADPEGDPEEIYNCRCRLSLQLKGIDHSNDKELYEQFMQENFPETWKSLQENEGYQARQEQEKAALERKERLLASKEEKLIPAPEKVSLEDAKESPNMIPEKPERPRRDDFDSDEAYQEAKEQYKEARAEYEKKKDEYIENLANDTKPMSREEFTQWTASHNVGIIENLDWDNIKSIDDADPKLVRLLTERYDELFAQFPSVLTYRQDFMEKMGESGTYQFEIGYSTNGYGAEASHGFVFGRGGNDFNLFVGDHYDGIASGHFTNAEDALNHIFDHEFGHNVQSTIATYNDMKENEVGYKFYEIASKAEGISEYATTNEDEFFAEAFAAWAGGSDTELARQMGNFLKEYGML